MLCRSDRLAAVATRRRRPRNVPAYREAIDNVDAFRFKQFCVTNHGFLCLVPAMAEPTDVIAIIKAHDVPVVLRPLGEFSILLGHCYIYSMVENQAMCLIDEFSIKISEGKRTW
jgi:hypothetical protein